MNIKKLQNLVISFRNKRNWKQFHNPKDVAISLSLEASELLEHFQWKNDREVRKYIIKNKRQISEELVDILYWVLLLSHDLQIDLEESFSEKMKVNDNKYPIKKSKGKSTKYTDL